MRINLGAAERTIRKYLEIGVDADLTELDLMINIALDKGLRITDATERNAIFNDQAILYAKLFMLLKEYAKGPGGKHHEEYGDVGVSRVTWWSMNDPGYHYYGYLWSGVGSPKEAYWAVIQPEEYLEELDLLPGGYASFDYGGKKYGARSWGDPHFVELDINVPAGVTSIDFTEANFTPPEGFVFGSIEYDPIDRSVSVGNPCHVTVKAYKTSNPKNAATYKLTFGQMAVSWYKDTGALEESLAYADVRFSDGVTEFKQYKTYYDRNDGTLKAFDSAEYKAVPKGERATLILKTGVRSDDHNSWGTKNFVLDKDYNPIPTTQKAWRLAKRIESGRTYMVMSAESNFTSGDKTYGYVLTNRTKPSTTASSDALGVLPAVPESLSRTPYVISGDILIPIGHRDEPNRLSNELAQDNVKFFFEEYLSPRSGPYATRKGYMLDCYIHGTNVYPQAVFRGNGNSNSGGGATYGNYYSLITRETNGSECPQIADKALDRAIFFNTPIDQDTGETRMFMYTDTDFNGTAVNKYFALKEVRNGTPSANTASGNAISRRQAIEGGFAVYQTDDFNDGTRVKLYVFD